jgi:hypothetical protein
VTTAGSLAEDRPLFIGNVSTAIQQVIDVVLASQSAKDAPETAAASVTTTKPALAQSESTA